MAYARAYIVIEHRDPASWLLRATTTMFDVSVYSVSKALSASVPCGVAGDVGAGGIGRESDVGWTSDTVMHTIKKERTWQGSLACACSAD